MSIVPSVRHAVAAARFVHKYTRHMSGTAADAYNYNNLTVSQPSEFVYNVEINRPTKLNALNTELWGEVGDFFSRASSDEDCRVVVVSGAGRMFCAGIDLKDFMKLANVVMGEEDVARKCVKLKNHIRHLQNHFTVMETCPKPVIGAIHSGCIGGGVDMISAMDIRLCTSDAYFQVKEVDLGLTADVGTLQRLPKIIGSQSLVSELCLTARKLGAEEADRIGLVSTVYPDKESMMTNALQLAKTIATKSPVAVQGTKQSLVYSREHSTQEGLDHVATYNMTMLQSEDLMRAVMASMDKDGPPADFSKL